MQAYTGFAQVYDIFMDNVPYDEWTSYVAHLLKEYGITSGLVLELGCGTGSVTRRLASIGYDMIGIDISEDMLEIARQKEYDLEYHENDLERSNKILYLQQDMREFELYGTVSAVVSICDSMNYITKEEELLNVFKLVNNYLDPGGIFIFDMNTVYKYENILAHNTIAENREDCSFIWENYYDHKTRINEYDMAIFVKVEEEDIYKKFQEIHYQKAYTIESIIELINKAGMEFITVYDAFTHNPPNEKSERVYFIAREKYQENKLYI